MSKHDQDELPTIDTADLVEVSGGTHRPGHNDSQLTAALQSITSSLSALKNQNDTSNNSLTQMLPFLMFAKGGGGGCPGGNCGR
jgi:hypothetical protein